MPHFSLAKNKRFRSKGLSSKQNYNSKPHLVKVDFKKLGSAHEVPLYIIRKKNRERERERERERRLTHYFHRAQIQNSSMTMKEFCTHLILCFCYHILVPDNGWVGVGDPKWHCQFFSLLKTHIQRGTSFPQRCLVTTPRLHFVVVV
jgi:hypothetical protein